MIGEVTFGVIGLLFLFADIRTFASTFQLTLFGAPQTNLAVMAVAVFATSFLGLLLSWRLGRRRALGSSAALFALATFLCTASRSNWIDLALSVVALAAGFWWLAFLHSARPEGARSPLPTALPLAFAFDLALRALSRTEAIPDLPWATAVLAVGAAAALFVATGLLAMAPDRQWTTPDARGLVGLFAVPCLVLVGETGATNGAQVALAAGLGLGPEASHATQVGQVLLGAGIAVGALALLREPRGVLAGAIVAVGAALLWLHVPFVSFAGGALLAAGATVAGAVLLGAPLRPATRPAGVIVALSFGWIAFVAAAFGFYAFWAYAPAVYAATGIVALGCVLAPRGGARLGRTLAIAMAVAAVAGPVAALVNTPAPPDATPAPRTFRFMTYNIHQGFDTGQIPSLEVLADTIRAESPDVVCLQEVVRGWMIDEQHDALSLLAERLGMQYVWLPNIGDLYGNAVLSRYAMTNVKRVAYAREPGIRHQPRGVLFVRTGNLTIGCTHLDELSDASIVRQEQVRTIIREAGDTTPLVIAGDLNAEPGDIEVRLLNEWGLDDLGQSAGDTTTGDTPQKRIDYVWGRGVVGAQAHTVSGLDLVDAKRASDHRPLIVNITVSP